MFGLFQGDSADVSASGKFKALDTAETKFKEIQTGKAYRKTLTDPDGDQYILVVTAAEAKRFEELIKEANRKKAMGVVRSSNKGMWGGDISQYNQCFGQISGFRASLVGLGRNVINSQWVVSGKELADIYGGRRSMNLKTQAAPKFLPDNSFLEVDWDGNGPIRIFTSGFKAVTEQLYKVVTEQLQINFKRVSDQLQVRYTSHIDQIQIRYVVQPLVYKVYSRYV